MDHPLHTITYVADIDHVLVIMAYVRPPPISRRAPPTSPPASENNGEEEVTKFIPKMTCHVLDTANVSIKTCKMNTLGWKSVKIVLMGHPCTIFGSLQKCLSFPFPKLPFNILL